MLNALTGAILGFAKPQGGKDAGNVFQKHQADSDKAIKDYLTYQGDQNILDPEKSGKWAQQQVQEDPRLAQLFGQDGTMQRAGQEEQQLATRGYSLKPEDYEAYGQASGDIARMFDTGEQSLAQAMQNRGLSSSGVAGKSFMTSQGSKLEQLGKLQTDIAQRRMQTNMQRLGQTRDFLGQMAGQYQGAVQGAYNRGMGSEQARFGQTQAKGQAGQQLLQDAQSQANTNLSQQQSTQTMPQWAKILGGFTTGANTDIANITGFVSAANGGQGSKPTGAPNPNRDATYGASGGNIGPGTEQQYKFQNGQDWRK